MKIVRHNLRDMRNAHNMSRAELAKNMQEMFGPGYKVSDQSLFAIESGITKSVPHWVVIGYMMILHAQTADDVFPFMGDM
jgi:DNA-binding XRE family transcriptional regulator